MLPGLVVPNFEEVKEDEYFKLVQKGMYVERPTRPINLDTIPMDGSEFIHKSRLEDAKLSYCNDPNIHNLSPLKTSNSFMKQWGREEAKEFTAIAMKLKSNRKKLVNKFPKKIETPEDSDEKKWCVFCLGSKLFSKIYEEKASKKSRGHPPVLSIVLHLSQKEVMMLITHLYKWVQVVGLNDDMGRWVYALFAALEKPIDEPFLLKLEDIYDYCETIVCNSDNEMDKYRVYLIMSLLKYYFCVKSYTVGPCIDDFFCV